MLGRTGRPSLTLISRRLGTEVVKEEPKRQVTPFKERSKVEKRVYTGIQPTGNLHLGNYFGAIHKWLEIQEDVFSHLYVAVSDLHSITLPTTAKDLRDNILHVTACLLACGLDPSRCTIFQQSQVAAHAELAWILGCYATTAQLQRMSQYKEKSAPYKDGNVPLGLLTYPVLQAADVLLYKCTHVPVGDDQVQHIQIARDLAKTFNRVTGVEYFVPPTVLLSSFARVRSLRNHEKKMSKSDLDSRSRIDLTDAEEAIREKIKRALTDFTSDVTYEPQYRPAVSNLVALHSMVTGKPTQQIVLENVDLNTAQYKGVLAEDLVRKLGPIREAYEKLRPNETFLHEVLAEGSKKAALEAERTIADVKRIVGLKLV